MSERRAYGDGRLYLRSNAKGGQTWIGQFWLDGRRATRSLGPKRSRTQPDGLTPAQAEAALHELREQATMKVVRAKRRTLAEVGADLIRAKESAGRKPATIEGYESWLRVHVVPFFGVQD